MAELTTFFSSTFAGGVNDKNLSSTANIEVAPVLSTLSQFLIFSLVFKVAQVFNNT